MTCIILGSKKVFHFLQLPSKRSNIFGQGNRLLTSLRQHHRTFVLSLWYFRLQFRKWNTCLLFHQLLTFITPTTNVRHYPLRYSFTTVARWNKFTMLESGHFIYCDVHLLNVFTSPGYVCMHGVLPINQSRNAAVTFVVWSFRNKLALLRFILNHAINENCLHRYALSPA